MASSKGQRKPLLAGAQQFQYMGDDKEGPIDRANKLLKQDFPAMNQEFNKLSFAIETLEQSLRSNSSPSFFDSRSQVVKKADSLNQLLIKFIAEKKWDAFIALCHSIAVIDGSTRLQDSAPERLPTDKALSGALIANMNLLSLDVARVKKAIQGIPERLRQHGAVYATTDPAHAQAVFKLSQDLEASISLGFPIHAAKKADGPK